MQPGLIKRIKGVPGDTIKVVFRSRYQIGYPDTDDEQNEVLTLAANRVEPLESHPCALEKRQTIIQVPPGHLWVEGDNPSRSVGTLTVSL